MDDEGVWKVWGWLGGVMTFVVSCKQDDVLVDDEGVWKVWGGGLGGVGG